MNAVPLWAYCGQRAVDRKSTKGSLRHALTIWARMSGAMDAECGVIGMVEVGPWDPGDPHNCPDCVKYVNGEVPVPEEVAALLAPAPPHRSGTPSLFDAA